METPNNKDVEQKKKERKQEKGHAGSVTEVTLKAGPGQPSRSLTSVTLWLVFLLFLAPALACVRGRAPQLVCGAKEGERRPAGPEGCTRQRHQRGDARRAHAGRPSVAHHALPAGLRHQVSCALSADSWPASAEGLRAPCSPSQSLADSAVVCRVSGQLWDLDRPLERDCSLEFLRFDHEDAQAVSPPPLGDLLLLLASPRLEERSDLQALAGLLALQRSHPGRGPGALLRRLFVLRTPDRERFLLRHVPPRAEVSLVFPLSSSSLLVFIGGDQMWASVSVFVQESCFCPTVPEMRVCVDP